MFNRGVTIIAGTTQALFTIFEDIWVEQILDESDCIKVAFHVKVGGMRYSMQRSILHQVTQMRYPG
jgi:hypothetical protein